MLNEIKKKFVKGTVLITVPLTLLSFGLKAQTEVPHITISPTIGITARSTMMNVFNFKAINIEDRTIPFSYEKNAQGIALSIGGQFSSESFGFEYYSNFRYDYISHYFDPQYNEFVAIINGDSLFFNDNPIHIKELIIDQNFNFYHKKNNKTFGVGLTLVNPGKGFHLENPKGTYRYINIQFWTYNAFITFPIKPIDVEFKVLYIPEDMPTNRTDDFLMYSLRIFYKFKTKKIMKN
ncbi:MAG: hypothetical protein ACNS60_09395 [Candidatus Cyclobacteriaceae bacterium M2_1C_046]